MDDIAVRTLIAARRERRRIGRLPEDSRPVDVAAGYALQRRIIAAMGEVGGWKIGAGGPDETPLYAPILAQEIHASGVTLPAAEIPDSVIESEIAFRLRTDLPPRPLAYDRASVAAAVDLVPALEIYRCRYLDPGAATAPEHLADCLANAGLIVGSPVPLPTPETAPTWDIDLIVDGEVKEGRALRHPVGDPLRLVVWLANELAQHGEGLRAGQVVTTGALVYRPLGREVRSLWQGIGAVSARFA